MRNHYSYYHAHLHSTPTIRLPSRWTQPRTTHPQQEGDEIYKKGGHNANKIKKLKKTSLGGLPMPLVREWSAMLVVGPGFNTN